LNNVNVSPAKKVIYHLRNNKRIKDVLLFVVLALVIVFAAWKLFYGDKSDEEDVFLTQTELKVSKLLENIQGVGEADVIVCETEDGVRSVVVVCDGANDLQVVMHIREAVAAAVGTDEKSIKIYLKKE
jgi:hypothetical protein